jgi:hypothetical protein
MREGLLDENGRVRWANDDDPGHDEHELPEPPDGDDEEEEPEDEVEKPEDEGI